MIEYTGGGKTGPCGLALGEKEREEGGGWDKLFKTIFILGGIREWRNAGLRVMKLRGCKNINNNLHSYRKILRDKCKSSNYYIRCSVRVMILLNCVLSNN